MKQIYEALKYTPSEAELEATLTEAVEEYVNVFKAYGNKFDALETALEIVVDYLDHTDDDTYCTVRFKNGYIEYPELVIEHEYTDYIDLLPVMILLRKQYDKQTKENRP